MAKEQKEKNEMAFNLEDMIKAGLIFGHQTSKIHPKIKPYLAGKRNGINLFDLEKTSQKLKEALDFVSTLVSEGKVLLLVGTKIQLKSLVKEIAIECGLPYISERWLGGTFTNFETLKKRIEYFKKLEKQRDEGELVKYTKKEQSLFNQEIRKMEIKFGGIKNMDKLPDAIFVVDMKDNETAIKEAKAKKVKIIAIADTNVNPDLADYPIPANDDSLMAVKYILDLLKEAVIKAKK